jgi:putative MATE family efflux protein
MSAAAGIIPSMEADTTDPADARTAEGAPGADDAAGELDAGHVTGRQILALAVPALGALLAEPLFVLADSAIVGHLGPGQLAGLGTAGSALNTLVNVCIFLAYSTTAQVSRLIGAGRRREGLARGMDGMYLAAGLGVLLAVIGVLGADPIVRWLGAGAQAAPYASTYLRISALGLPGMLLVLAATGLLRGLHDMRTPLLVAGAAALINTLANWILVYPCGFGIAGSAAGTAGVQTAMGALYAYLVVKACRAQGVAPRFNARAVRASLSANFALLARTIGLRIYLLAAIWGAGRLGTTALAAHTIAMNLWGTLALALDALAIAAQALVGHELGAGRTEQVRKVVARMNRWGLGFGVITGIGLAALSPVLALVFTSDRAIGHALIPVLLVAALFQPAAGVVFVLDGVLIGAGDTVYLAWASLACTAVFLACLAAVLAAGWGLTWLWVAVGLFTLARLGCLWVRAEGTRWMRVGGEIG